MILVSNGNAVPRDASTRPLFVDFGSQRIADSGRVVKGDIHIQGEMNITIGVGGGGKRGFRQRHHRPAMRFAMWSHKVRCHRQRHARVAGTQLVQRRTDGASEGVIGNGMVEWGVKHRVWCWRGVPRPKGTGLETRLVSQWVMKPTGL